ncbi:D-3-phosphoglycerate dehydrogenase [Flavobacterium sp. 270]|uniref:NAD(P)-dependent oxidoreductase n=1 Tax=Flavobacterium sp. 270 TaxID=2512114 RepID=UPI00106512EE|nr:2-hydroxyacid dehydrogenase [Flavobacterium sp. 270]TDW47158.1 D-3-phosphoglycerate dehydrogenase [Flavobacterium sp. 270]
MKNGKMKILITESEDFSQDAINELQKYFEVTKFNLDFIEELTEIIADFDFLFVRLRFKLTKEILEKAPKLKYILTATTGLDHIDADYFESIGGRIISLKGETQFLGTIPSTAEHTWALLMAMLKKIPAAFDDVKKGNWNRDNFKGNNFKGKNIGILGMGRVGKQVADFAEVFQLNVGYYDTHSVKSKFKSFKSPIELFAWSDIISIHIPYNSENDNFIDAQLLQSCNPNAILINTSRGNVWDEKAIIELLEKKKIKGVATDVLQNEFDKTAIFTNPLIKLAKKNSNIIITPHIAGASYESMQITEEFIVEKFIRIMKCVE